MRFLYVRGDQMAGDAVELDAEQSHRVSRVLRLGAGDGLVIRVRETGLLLAAVVGSRGRRDRLGLTVTGPASEPPEASPPPVEVHLGVALLKRRNLELVMQKTVELGVASVTPLLARRSVDRHLSGADLRRLAEIAEEACQQCGRPLPPPIPELATPEDFALAQRRAGRSVILLHEAPVSGEGAGTVGGEGGDGGVAVMVGPEGGWDGAEVTGLRDAGATPRRLPGHVLRAETAAVAVVALLVLDGALSGAR